MGVQRKGETGRETASEGEETDQVVESKTDYGRRKGIRTVVRERKGRQRNGREREEDRKMVGEGKKTAQMVEGKTDNGKRKGWRTVDKTGEGGREMIGEGDR